MKSLFTRKDNDEIVQRLNDLTPGSKPHWGKMNVAQMLSHLQAPMEVAFGHRKLKRTLIGMLFGKMAKKKMAGTEPFSKNLPTDKNFLITGDKNFEAEREKVISLVRTFAEKGPAVLSGEPHPFFGKMTEQEWDNLSWKHLDHHLRQFGV